MTVYVDPLMDFGWKPRGVPTRNCHLFCDSPDLAELHALALRIGMPRGSFQPHAKAPHYDLGPVQRAAAIALGAIAVNRRDAVRLWQSRLQLIAQAAEPPADR